MPLCTWHTGGCIFAGLLCMLLACGLIPSKGYSKGKCPVCLAVFVCLASRSSGEACSVCTAGQNHDCSLLCGPAEPFREHSRTRTASTSFLYTLVFTHTSQPVSIPVCTTLCTLPAQLVLRVLLVWGLPSFVPAPLSHSLCTRCLECIRSLRIGCLRIAVCCLSWFDHLQMTSAAQCLAGVLQHCSTPLH
jgi:hypothetical protein